MIERDYLYKACCLLSDATMDLRVGGDKELVKRICDALDKVNDARCRVWALTESDE